MSEGGGHFSTDSSEAVGTMLGIATTTGFWLGSVLKAFVCFVPKAGANRASSSLTC